MQYQNLNEYNSLNLWYARQKEIIQDDSLCQCAFNLCEAISQKDITTFITSLSAFIESSNTPLEDIQDLRSFFSSHHYSLDEALSHFAEKAALSSNTIFYKHLKKIGSKSQFTPYQFVTAWLAFNLNLNQDCITICHAADIRSASFLALEGQAQMELGRLDDAKKALEESIHLSQNDAMTWFQIAKLYHIMNQYELAWEALDQCDKVTPNHAEVLAYKVVLALNNPKHDIEKLNKAWSILTDDSFTSLEEPDTLVDLFEIATATESYSRADWIIKNCSVDKLTQENNKKKMTAILRKLHQIGWHKQSEALLTKIIASQGAMEADEKF